MDIKEGLIYKADPLTEISVKDALIQFCDRKGYTETNSDYSFNDIDRNKIVIRQWKREFKNYVARFNESTTDRRLTRDAYNDDCIKETFKVLRSSNGS